MVKPSTKKHSLTQESSPEKVDPWLKEPHKSHPVKTRKKRISAVLIDTSKKNASRNITKKIKLHKKNYLLNKIF